MRWRHPLNIVRNMSAPKNACRHRDSGRLETENTHFPAPPDNGRCIVINQSHFHVRLLPYFPRIRRLAIQDRYFSLRSTPF